MSPGVLALGRCGELFPESLRSQASALQLVFGQIQLPYADITHKADSLSSADTPSLCGARPRARRLLLGGAGCAAGGGGGGRRRPQALVAGAGQEPRVQREQSEWLLLYLCRYFVWLHCLPAASAGLPPPQHGSVLRCSNMSSSQCLTPTFPCSLRLSFAPQPRECDTPCLLCLAPQAT
jgi:hypothetical protein